MRQLSSILNLVSYYKRPKLFRVLSTEVETHEPWQPPTQWHAFLKPELHGLPTPRASFLNSWQTNTRLTSFAFAQIETKRSTRVSFFFFHARSFLEAKL